MLASASLARCIITPLDQAKAQFEVNFFGTVNVNKAALASMREAGKGHIINISSVAAVAHIPFQAFYSASKAAISSYSCALDNGKALWHSGDSC